MTSVDQAAPSITPTGILRALAVLALCQLAGELLTRGARVIVPEIVFPGPVAGMLLLFGVLCLRGRMEPDLATVSSSLLGMLSLLFIPAAVGVVQYFPILAQWGPQLVLAVVGSTVLTLLVTVFTFLAVERLVKADRK